MLSFLLSVFIINVCNGALQMPLRQAAQKAGIMVGTALNYGTLNQDKNYASVGAQQYDLVTAENGCKWGATEPQQNHFTFTQCDYISNFAKSNSMTFRGHNLCWGNSNPSWLTNGNFNSDQLKQILQNHITKVIQHYPGNTVYSWDVVNEAVNDNPSQGLFKNNVWYPKVPDYVNLAFKYAKAANPNIKLFYNDYNILMSESWMKAKSDAVYNMVRNMTRSGLKVDGIGMQAHIDTSSVDYNAVVTNMQRYADLGIEVHITEMDVSDQSNNQNPQAQVYETVLRACRAVKTCKNFESWGYTDKYTWLGESKHPLPFDENFQPKQAAYAIEQELLNSTISVQHHDQHVQ